MLHFHWPQDHYRHPPRPKGPVSWAKMGLFTLRLWGARALGYRLAWTIHEVYPLKTASRRLDRLGGRLLARACHVLFANDDETAALAREELGRAAERVTGRARTAPTSAPTRKAARAPRCGPSSGSRTHTFVFLLFGHVTRLQAGRVVRRGLPLRRA